ncbi:MAG TPA: trehalose-phosphatase, partial [Spirochaetota bacterium]|nr:trehalose-phosphatase [Spirochaetota bacterium]
LYNLSDIALVTPIRDGMNLVAEEYIASKVNKKGVLILSEMAGAAEELGRAIIVNPNDKDEIADSLNYALEMPLEEQTERIKVMQERIKRNNVFRWASLFIEKLENTKFMEDKFKVNILDAGNKEKLISNYDSSSKRLFLLDYDGTLTGFTQKIDDAKPDKELYSILNNIVKDKRNKVVIISGRNKDSLELFFQKMDITLVAEHGAWIKFPNEEWSSILNFNTSWKDEIRPILEYYVDRTPKSFIEEKSFSLGWHYRNSDLDLASIRLKELKENLMSVLANLNLGILDGIKVLEVKNLEINKGKTAFKIINSDNYDFILSAGDDTTDEDIFSVVPEDSYSIKVGLSNSKAKYNLNDFYEVRKLLKDMGDR